MVEELKAKLNRYYEQLQHEFQPNICKVANDLVTVKQQVIYREQMRRKNYLKIYGLISFPADTNAFAKVSISANCTV